MIPGAVWNISNHELIEQIGSGSYGEVWRARSSLVADGSNGVEIIDVADPANPVRLGGKKLNRASVGICVVESYAYVGKGNDPSLGKSALSPSIELSVILVTEIAQRRS